MLSTPLLQRLALLALAVSVPLQQALPSPIPARGQRFSAAEGLSQSTVNAIIQDRQGFMWFGTQDGLNRFDGYTFNVYRHVVGDSSSLPDNFIWTLLEDREGRLWAGTLGGGLACYLPGEDRFVTYRPDGPNGRGLGSGNITALAEDRQGNLFVGTWGKGLRRWRPEVGVFEEVALSPGVSGEPHVRCLHVDGEGALWVGTWEGLLGLDLRSGTVRVFRHDPNDPTSLSGDRIQFVKEDARGALWVGTYDQGLNRFDRMSGRAVRYTHRENEADGPGSDHLLGACFDPQGLLWIGTEDAGIDIVDPSTGIFSHFRRNDGDPWSIGSDRIFSLALDQEQAMWVGTADAGVSRHALTRPNFRVVRRRLQSAGGLSADVVRAVTQDTRGRLWVGTAGGGLDCLDSSTGSFRHFPLSSLFVFAVLADRSGTIWTGTQNEGVDRLDPSTGRFKNFPRLSDGSTLKGSSVMAICEDAGGAVWFGTSGQGLVRYDPQLSELTRVVLKEPAGTANQPANVWAIHQDQAGNFWLGTWGSGVWKVDPEGRIVARYRHDARNPRSLGNNTVWSITADGEGGLWLGTAGGGLDHYHPGSDDFSHHTMENGLPNNVVYGVLPDGRGRFWLSTNHGLTRLDPSDGSCRNYDETDGLQGNEFNQGAFCRGNDGTLYFGGTAGLTIFHPDSIRVNTHIPPIVLTRFRVFDRPMPIVRSPGGSYDITISYAENFIAFEFAALDYHAPRRNQYAYRLEGSDPDWVYCGSRRYAAYTHLEPGTHVFRVKGSNNDGVWNEEGIAVRIMISPPFWRTPWFLALALAVALWVAVAIYRYSVTRMVELERLRTRIASDLHDELASNLSSIAMFSNILYDAARAEKPLPAEHDQLFRRITALSQESVASIRDIIWAIDPRPETVGNLLLRFRDSIVVLCRARNIRLDFADPLPEQLPRHNLSPEQRKNLWLLLKETVMNAVYHSSCRSLAITWIYERGVLRLDIVDDGRGFEKEKPSRGKGLETMRMRAGRLKGSVSFDSSPGKGTAVRIEIPT